MKIKSRRVAIVFSAAVLAGIGSLRTTSAAVIAGWDFDAGGAIAAPYNTPASTSGNGTATQLGMTNSYTFGTTTGSTASCDVLASAGASTGAGSFGWRVRGPGTNSGTGTGNGWNSAAPIATQGAEFSASTVGATGIITVTFDVDTTAQAERNLAVEYTLNGTTWAVASLTSAGTLGTLATNSSSANTVTGQYVQLGSGWNNQITASISGATGNANFGIEIVNASTGTDDVNVSGAALNNTSGNWRYDNVVIATPEPASLSVFALGAVALGARRRRVSR